MSLFEDIKKNFLEAGASFQEAIGGTGKTLSERITKTAVKLGETGLSLSCDVSERMPKNLSGYRTNGCTVNVAPCSSGMTFEWLAKNKKRGLSLWAFPLQTVHCGNISPVLCYGGLKTEFIEN